MYFIKLILSTAFFVNLVSSVALAEKLIRAESGMFYGRIAKSTNNNTVPLNTDLGIYLGGEYQQFVSKTWRLLVGGSYFDYPAKRVGASSIERSQFSYYDAKLGVVAGWDCCEWRLLYTRSQTPFTYEPEVNLVLSETAPMDFIRAEALLSGKAANFKLAFYYYIAHAISELNTTVAGIATNDFYIGGCARILLGTKIKWGPAICIDLQELSFPDNVIVFRQEVHGRLSLEF